MSEYMDALVLDRLKRSCEVRLMGLRNAAHLAGRLGQPNSVSRSGQHFGLDRSGGGGRVGSVIGFVLCVQNDPCHES